MSLDGVYLRGPETDKLVFHSLPTPSSTEVADVATRTRARLERIFKKHGRSLDPHTPSDADAHPLEREDPGLSACYAAAAQGVAVSGERAGQPTLRLVVTQSSPPQATSSTPSPDEPVAEVGGISLFAKQRVDGRDRRQLERLCRYIARPPVAQNRLEKRSDGRFKLTLKSVWKDGTRAVLFEGQDLILRLIAAIPPPRFHLLRYYGVLSSHSALRSEVVPTPRVDPAAHAPPPAPGDQLELLTHADGKRPGAPKRWAWLLKHVFAADLDICPRCGGPMRWSDAATSSEDIQRLMAAHGLMPRPPPRRPPAPAPGQLGFRFR